MANCSNWVLIWEILRVWKHNWKLLCRHNILNMILSMKLTLICLFWQLEFQGLPRRVWLTFTKLTVPLIKRGILSYLTPIRTNKRKDDSLSTEVSLWTINKICLKLINRLLKWDGSPVLINWPFWHRIKTGLPLYRSLWATSVSKVFKYPGNGLECKILWLKFGKQAHPFTWMSTSKFISLKWHKIPRTFSLQMLSKKNKKRATLAKIQSFQVRDPPSKSWSLQVLIHKVSWRQPNWNLK